MPLEPLRRAAATRRLRDWAAAVLLPVFLSGFSACNAPMVEEASYEILLTLPHDTAAYTQGLVFHERTLYESTGGWGKSALRQVDPRTGAVVRSHPLPDSLFGEGLARVDDRLVQLTWKAGLAFVYDLESFAVTDTLTYDGEGWGLCFDGARLWMSNGSDSLYSRDPETFAVLGARAVTAQGVAVDRLNELECVGEHVWANVWMEDRIVQIDKETGRVARMLNGYQLRLASGVTNDGNAVLNGIAYAEGTDVYFLTGKLWPEIYVVRIAQPGQAGGT